ncbi:MAG: YigZ family protein [Bacteroidales bacterium]|nr:YigZ family protein [Bacteroidales bacterium]
MSKQLQSSYKTIAAVAEGVYREKGSKFIAFAIPVKDEEEIKEKLLEIKKKYYDARHHCYAYILDYDQSTYRINDDGEPSGTAGRPIHGQLLSKELTFVLLVVVRYFGGIKLGVSGLIRAYKEASRDALENATIIEKYIKKKFQVTTRYESINSVMNILKSDSVTIRDQQFEMDIRIQFLVHQVEAEAIVGQLEKVANTEVIAMD